MTLRNRWLLIGIGFATPVASAADSDYIYSSSFEVLVCDGQSCSYCSPANPVPLCGSNSHCTPQQDSTSVCSYPAGTGMSGASCNLLSDCAGPLACINSGVSTTCQNWCAFPAGVCPGAQTCVHLVPAVSTGSIEWGVCI